MKIKSFELISNLLKFILDFDHKNNDITNTLSVMILSQTFFY